MREEGKRIKSQFRKALKENRKEVYMVFAGLVFLVLSVPIFLMDARPEVLGIKKYEIFMFGRSNVASTFSINISIENLSLLNGCTDFGSRCFDRAYWEVKNAQPVPK